MINDIRGCYHTHGQCIISISHVYNTVIKREKSMSMYMKYVDEVYVISHLFLSYVLSPQNHFRSFDQKCQFCTNLFTR